MNNLKPTDKIKLVIFDLDETFWNGVLSSEESIQPKPSAIKLVKTLVDNGIMCSISSKNDFETAKKKLIELKVWDNFIFPSINWNPKGAQIAKLIKDAHLRDENVLFIDDNPSNLAEAQYYCPSIKIATPDIFENMLKLPAIQGGGKNDKDHTRLKQYKILETKQAEAQKYNDNTEFLKASQIKVTFSDVSDDKIERTIELILRTNQLNFTKKRIDNTKLKSLLKNQNYENKLINVSDKYGDYGICGYYCLNKKNKTLEHFIFSCRIMNLKVEQFIYAKLNFPKIKIVEPVSTQLNNYERPDFINKDYNLKTKNNKKIKTKVLLLGNCDMQSISHYATGTANNIEVDFHVDINPETHMQIRYDSIWKMKNALSLSDEQKNSLIKTHKWICAKSFENRAFKDNYDILAFSVLNDYIVPTYQDKLSHIILTPTTSYKYNIFTAPVDTVLKLFKENNIINFSKSDVLKMQRNLINERFMTEKEFEKNLNWLVEHVHKPIIFLNGPEVLRPNDDVACYKRFVKYNKILDKFVNTHENCFLVDVRNYVKEPSDTTDVVTHYHRETYIKLAEDLLTIINNNHNKVKYLLKIKLMKLKLAGYIKNISKLRKKICQFRFGHKEKYLILFGKTIFKADK